MRGDGILRGKEALKEKISFYKELLRLLVIIDIALGTLLAYTGKEFYIFLGSQASRAENKEPDAFEAMMRHEQILLLRDTWLFGVAIFLIFVVYTLFVRFKTERLIDELPSIREDGESNRSEEHLEFQGEEDSK